MIFILFSLFFSSFHYNTVLMTFKLFTCQWKNWSNNFLKIFFSSLTEFKQCDKIFDSHLTFFHFFILKVTNQASCSFVYLINLINLKFIHVLANKINIWL